MRIGHGYDAHRLVPGRRLMLGGVEIPHHMGLLGHSDADALAHAIADALLGAAGLGDIGEHFPDTDGRYKNMPGLELLRAVVKLTGAPVNVDATVIAQGPKLAPYRQAMRENLASALGLDCGKVNVKFKTEEGMGFTGSGEGIAAHAVTIIAANARM